MGGGGGGGGGKAPGGGREDSTKERNAKPTEGRGGIRTYTHTHTVS